jgi:hypothetical protein
MREEIISMLIIRIATGDAIGRIDEARPGTTCGPTSV